MSNTLELAILHADACGFSAAMAANEDLAIAKLIAGQNIIARAAQMYSGRVVDTAGDSALLTFDSTRDAFHAACHIGESVSRHGSDMPGERPFDYRIGLARGRVKIHGDKIFGACVNTAARIDTLVRRGNIGIERSVWAEVQPLALHKHVQPRVLFAKPNEPVVDFFEISDGTPAPGGQIFTESLRNEPHVLILPQFHDAKLRIVNEVIDAFLWDCSAFFSAQGWQASIADRRIEGVDSNATAADYLVKVRATSLQSGFRLSVSLASRHDFRGTQYFTREFDNTHDSTTNALALASLVGSAIAHIETERAAARGFIGSHQLVAAGRACLAGFSAEHFARGLAFLKSASRLDPEYPMLLSSMARAYAVAWRFGWNVDGNDTLELARRYADDAVRLAPNDARCQADLGFVRFWAKEPEESAWHYERSLDTLPFHPELAADAGMVFSYVDRHDQAAAVLERSIANLPNNADYRLWSLGDVYYAKRDYRNSLKWLARMSDQTQAQRMLAANKARLGLDPSRHVANVLAQQPTFSVRRWVAIQPFTNDRDRVDYEEALILAGLPA
jgi:tetratricopeptide (TPR) repeat protein